MILTDDQALAIVKKESESIPENITTARNKAIELNALINGVNFADELIERIEFLESDAKATARKKHSRNIVDLFERLMLPISNVFVSSGGSKKYITDNISESQSKDFMAAISDVKDGKSVERYTESTWMPLYHSDPNGIIFMEYVSDPKPKCYPTYKSVGVVRNYLPKGQNVEWVMFEFKTVTDKPEEKLWRIVCDKYDRTIIQIGTGFMISEDPKQTFEHPFGECPTIINSNIVDLNTKTRLSPFERIIPISKEYARDQSFLSIYKPLHGSPLHWKYVSQCKKCLGVKKVEGRPCPDCDGHGYYKGKDVTDIVTIPVPKKDEQKLDPIAGYISPDLKTWGQYNTELEKLELSAQDTHWGTHVENKGNETATGRFIDVQPVINRLNKYADVAEWVEWKLTEWIANFTIPTKDRTKNIASIVYGRRYIIDSTDTILQRYNDAKVAGENNTILDRLFNEYLLSKYKNDPEWLRIELVKSQIEPYLHVSLSDTFKIFGVEGSKKKVFFKSWWESNNISDEFIKKDIKVLKTQFDTDFKVAFPAKAIDPANPTQ